MSRFEEIRALCEEATPGLVRRGTSGIFDDGTTALRAMLAADAKLFVRARQIGIDLLAEIECGAATIEAYKATAERLTRELAHQQNLVGDVCDAARRELQGMLDRHNLLTQALDAAVGRAEAAEAKVPRHIDNYSADDDFFDREYS